MTITHVHYECLVIHLYSDNFADIYSISKKYVCIATKWGSMLLCDP